jgi:UDP-glucose-4-epimerase GalE
VGVFLITGGAGYVGSHTVKALARAGHTCVTYDNLSTGHRDFARWGPLVEADIRDASALDATFRDHPIDAVIHFAARAYVAESVTDPGRYYDINVNGTRILLDAMVRANVKRIVFSSSCAVYGVVDAKPITEDLPTQPINPYGYTKLVCERMMQDYETAHGMASMRLRYFNAAGADPEHEIGEHHDPEPHLIPLVLDVAAARRPAINVYGVDYPTPDGSAVRDYIHVCDLASAHVAAAQRLADGGASMSINLGAGEMVSVRQVVRAAEEVTGRRIPMIESERRPGDPPMLVASADLARRTLGWTPQRSDMHAILTDAWAWTRKRFGDAHNVRDAKLVD